MPRYRYTVRSESVEVYEIEADAITEVESLISEGIEGELIESEDHPGDIDEIWEVEDA